MIKIPGSQPQLPVRDIPPQLPAGDPLNAEEKLRRRAEEADVNTFFSGGDPANRTTTEEENQALGEFIKEKIAAGEVKVIPGLFTDKEDGEAEDSSSD